MPKAPKKTCLVLASQAQSPGHAALFTQMAHELGFELIRMQGGFDRAACLLRASFVLADVSGNDPEVLYCLGVAHTFGKRVFLVTDTIDSLPYDLASCRAWVVDPASDNRDILRAMTQFLGVPYAIGPVRIFLGKFAYFGENLIGLRFVAFLIDALWMLILLGILLHLVVPSDQASFMATLDAWFREMDRPFESEDPTAAQTVIVAMAYGVFGYFALSTWLLRATLGQYFLGLRVVQTDYRRATFGQCVGRAVLSMLVIVTYGAAFLSAMRRPGYRAVHDALSGTIVVRTLAF
jgi:uncharacterized RDD family membrane protein YckC